MAEHAIPGEDIAPEIETSTGAPHAPAAEPTALFFDATGWVALAMVAVIALMLWKKVPSVIGAALDRKIAGIRAQLDEATRLRDEAEALRAEYQNRSAAAADEAKAMLDRARVEADDIVSQAQTDADALIQRRGRLAEEKIAAAERAAIAEVRARAATAATAAAAALIEKTHDAGADKALVDRTIAELETGSRA